ncbi:MAG: nucleotidyl transferase AbiEii/AbiGii toxin family protein [Bdellovibrionota bacterium]|nr:nucleotidyl transferase AbiEii/AbiGii toxin family protein [Bdellovibrionota bacterium]
MSSEYTKTVELLLEILPYALKDERVALKGGTAINLFHRDFPRLSVDIDLCYLPLESRKETFENIHGILASVKSELESKLNLNVISNHPLDGKKEAKLIASKNDIEVKIEPNYTLRSSLFSPEKKLLSPLAQKEFGMEVEVQCLGLADTFGGKICAALDRQHPRDLFDVKNLLENEGITRDVMDSFIFYLVSHNRPINELLNPNFKNIENEYKNEFLTMAQIDTPLDELLDARTKLVENLINSLTNNDKDFLISFVSNKPDWSKVRDQKIKDFPSVKWKMMNQETMKKDKQEDYLLKMREVFTMK